MSGPIGNRQAGSSQSVRHEAHDRPLIEARIKQICPACTVRYANAQVDVAA